MELDGKVAVVTGAASGLGRDTARAFAAAGMRIAAFDRDAAGLDALRAELVAVQTAQVVDVADEASVRSGLEETVRICGAVHVAVNCAGVEAAAKTVSRGEPFPLDKWRRVIEVNLTGTFNVIRLSAVAMLANAPEDGERGVIVNTASGAATQGQVGQAAYSASKAGVIGLTLPVARDLAQHGIRVVTISPGLFETAMVAGLAPEVAQALLDRMMLFPARMGRPAEFGALVRHVAENSYLNATTIDLDGGSRMSAR